jgi:hypothetical protein
MSYTVEVKQDYNGELYIDLPDQLIKELGWDEYTDLEWVVEEGKVYLKKKEEEVSK